MKKALVGVMFIGFIVACSPKTAEIVEAVPEMPEEDIAAVAPTVAIANGKALYDGKCNKCHEPKIIDAYSLEQWNKILPVMSEKAKLLKSDEGLIYEYIVWEIQN